MSDGLIVANISAQMHSDTQNPQLAGRPTPYTWRRRFSVNVALTLGTRLIMLASALGSSIIVARLLGAEGVGSLAVISVTVALAVQLGCAGLPSANTYFIAQDRSKLSIVWSNSLVFGLFGGSIIAGGLILVARFRPALLGHLPVSLVTVAAVSIPFQLVTLLGQNVFLGAGQIDRFNIIDAVAQLLLLLNALVALALLGTGLYGLVSFNSAVAILVSVTVAVMLSRSVTRKGDQVARLDAKVFRRMISYGMKFHIAAVACLLTLRADLLIVNHFRGAKEAGVYALAAQMGSLLMLLPAIIATLLFPRVASEPDSQGGLTMKATRHTAFIMLFACLAAVPLSFALPLVYGAAFRDSTIQLLILLPGIYLLGIESVMVQHFNSLGLPVAIPTFWIIALVCNLTFNLVLIPVFGAIGAAAVSTFTYGLIFALVAGYFRLKTGNRLSTALLLRGDEFRELISPSRLGFFLR